MAGLDHQKSRNDSGLDFLKEMTEARVGLGRIGSSLPTAAVLKFKLAHAGARDAVYSPLLVDQLRHKLAVFNLPVVPVFSQALDRPMYLQRPDLGRRLSKESATLLDGDRKNQDIVICIADGLSSLAIEKNVFEVLNFLLPKVEKARLTLSNVYIVTHGRVAIADQIGEIVKAKLSLIFIGERPGLSSADSMGIYLTYGPGVGLTDNFRNCISNIRDGGLSANDAADKAFYLIEEAFRRKLSGVELKDAQNDHLLSQE